MVFSFPPYLTPLGRYTRELLALLLIALPGFAQTQFPLKLPGEGITVQAVRSDVPEESFQTEIVNRALKALGYTIAPTQIADYLTGYHAIAHGDFTFSTVGWFPLHSDMYSAAGGRQKLSRQGHFISGAIQGYMINKSIADQYDITNIAQLKDAKLAALFDQDGDGKADLIGCNQGWGCEHVVNVQLGAFGLSDTVTHHQGDYAHIMKSTIARFHQNKPVLYYAWKPYWVSSILEPGVDVVWLEVPFSALPGERQQVKTRLPNGRNFGFEMNSMRIVANRQFIEENPAAAKLFSIMRIDINDIMEQNLKMNQGANRPEDIERHVDEWLLKNQHRFNRWITRAKQADRDTD
ncbi:glycine betaine/L-proline ABC transporter substrate-binding protein ProX [Vibrio sp. SM6]|uniref:Glycine betaine/L-proline ABC transporter substrate-binding protein ProX n=1 Tax=Vibrio agarilyticus TaxID=2726741 RepID=A0A7X8YFA9_9VIBR|nr:glycine betaine/L-proline ABC transporter substrate-binding protein ProX [Vibrio agarilyticus]NLS11693.1 glycine betaine/L-proline ABC transporter substrate-binding protein ProX [Vibrio agarilyticus]